MAAPGPFAVLLLLVTALATSLVCSAAANSGTTSSGPASASSSSSSTIAAWDVVVADDSAAAAPLMRLAAREAARYVRLLRCGAGAAADSAPCARRRAGAAAAAFDNEPGAAGAGGFSAVTILVALRDDVPSALQAAAWAAEPGAAAAEPATLGAALAGLTGDAHIVHTQQRPRAGAAAAAPPALLTVCAGATPRATLYAVYALLESLGARFSLAGDLLPPPNAALAPPARALLAQPVFARRGLQPFHDFPMGPDWWSADFYKATASNMAKMRMNLWGFHTYPFGGAGAEPMVWVGERAGFDAASGNVSEAGAYTSSWYLTMDFPRGNVPGSVTRATSDFCCGAAALFARDCYGSNAQASECWPATPASEARVLNDAAALLSDAFSWAASAAGVESCVGIEIPLTRPPGSSATLPELYDGIFARLAAAMPSVTCMWLWTTEGVEDHGTGKGLPQSNPLWAQLTAEIGVALAARDAYAPHVAVGANGWCLGPGDNSSYFDKVISDPRFSLSSISGCLGWCDVDAGFSNVTAHAGISIPWMEDDLGLSGAELWVERTLSQASASASYGASGLLGIMWRTWETSPQIAALAAAGWQGAAALTPLGIYESFCAANFGGTNASAAECAGLFLALDGSTEDGQFSPPASRLPRGGQGCCGGPMYPGSGGGEGDPRIMNLTAFEAWAAGVTGAANSERAARWLGLFEYHNLMAQASIAGAALQVAAAQVHDEATARAVGFPALAAMSWAWTALITSLLAITTTPGELGMLGAHEGANWPSNFLAAAGPILPYLTSCPAADAPAASCYNDTYTVSGRVLPYTVTIDNAACSREWCARECVSAGYALAGVEFGVACFCGDALPPAGFRLPNAACTAMACAGAPSERCGDADIISVYSAACPPQPDLPPGLLPSHTFAGAPRLWLTTVRTAAAAAEGALRVEAAVLSAAPPDSVALTWWTVGAGGASANTTLPMVPVAAGRSVFAAAAPLPTDTSLALEYIVEAAFEGGATLVAPVEGAVSVSVI